jgi:hypothetical protein
MGDWLWWLLQLPPPLLPSPLRLTPSLRLRLSYCYRHLSPVPPLLRFSLLLHLSCYCWNYC